MFSLLGLLFCVIARALNIFPLSLIANCCRRKGENRISLKAQCVLWFAGLRGAIAFALSMNMPGPNSDSYASATLFICMFTTIVCGGFTENMLTRFGMKQGLDNDDDESDDFIGVENLISTESPLARRLSDDLQKRYTNFWYDFDDNYMKELFGGDRAGSSDRLAGDYELSEQDDLYDF